MDSLTQAALGAVVAHGVLAKPMGRKALLLGAVLGTLPDLDVLIPYGNDVDNFIYHRGFSHSLFVLLTVSPFLAWVLHRVFSKLDLIQTLSYKRLLIAVTLALCTHPLLDGFTSYGTQIFWPIGAPWHGPYPVAWSTIFIIDPFYTLPLLIAVGIAFYQPLRSTASRVALGISSIYLAWSITAKHLVEKHVYELLEERSVNDAKIFSTPSPFTTLLYRIIAVDGDEVYEGHISVLKLIGTKDYRPSFSNYSRNTNLVAKVSSTNSTQDEIVSKLSWFSQGFYRIEKQQEKLIFTDLRMGEVDNYVFRFVVSEESEDFTEQLNVDYSFDNFRKVYEKL